MRSSQRGNQLLLLHAAFARPLVGDQRVRDLGERGLNGFLILDQRAVAFRFGKLHVGFETSGGEDRLGDLRNETPGAVRAGEQARQLRALAAEESAEADLRESRRPWPRRCWRWRRSRASSAARISGRRSSSADGSPAGTSGGISCSMNLRPRTTAPGFSSEQEADLVFRLLDLLLQWREWFPRRCSRVASAWRRSSSVATPPPRRSCTKPQGILARCEGSLRDLQLVIELQEIESNRRRRRSPAW